MRVGVVLGVTCCWFSSFTAKAGWAADELSGVAVLDARTRVLAVGDETPRAVFTSRLPFETWESSAFAADVKKLDDLEGASPVPGAPRAAYVMTSQSRTTSKKKVKAKRNRFARIELDEGGAVAQARVCEGLRDALLVHLRAALPDLPASFETGSPETGGLNVEGIEAVGSDLLIGLREPRAPAGGVLIVPLRDVATWSATCGAPSFGPPLVVDAPAGLGVRGLGQRGDHVLILLGAQNATPGLPASIVAWHPETGATDSVEVPGLEALRRVEGIAAIGDDRVIVIEDVKDGSDAIHVLKVTSD